MSEETSNSKIATDGIVENIVNLDRNIKALTVLLDENKDLIKEFPGEKFTARDGSTVSVSKKTEDRVDGTKVVFDEEKYLSMDADIRASLDKMGIVKVVPKTVKGSAPRVTIKQAVK